MAHGGDHHGGHHGAEIDKQSREHPGGGFGLGHHGGAFNDFLHLTAHPHGSLAIGFEPGLGYAAGHNVSHIGNVHVGLADMAAVAIAIDVATHHGHNQGLRGFHTGHLHEIPAFRHCAVPHPGGREFNIPGISRDVKSVEVLQWPHGKCDPQQFIRDLARKLKMERINVAASNGLPDINKTELRLCTWVPFDAGDPVINLPDGWYNGASGETHIWREYFQVPQSTMPFFGNPDWVPWRTFLVVTGVTWHFAETDDYETRVAFTPYSIPMTSKLRGNQPKTVAVKQDFRSTGGQPKVISAEAEKRQAGVGVEKAADPGGWTYDWKDIKTHRDRAEKLAAGVFDYLRRALPPATAVSKRKDMHVAQLQLMAAPAPHQNNTAAPNPVYAVPLSFDPNPDEEI